MILVPISQKHGEDQETTLKIQKIVTILTSVGSVVSVVVLLVLGVKYITASVEQKADYKKSMIPYIIGATLTFSASTIVQIISKVANGFT